MKASRTIPPDARGRCEHVAQLYSDSESLGNHVAMFVAAALRRGECAMIIATAPHVGCVKDNLSKGGLDTKSLIRQGRLICLDANEALERITIDGTVDEAAFLRLIIPLIERVAGHGSGMAVYGEIVNLLWKQGRADEADQLEQWWNQLIDEYGFSLMCGYHADLFDPTIQAKLDRVCRCHSHLVVCEDGKRLELAFDAALQQVFPHASIDQMRSALMDRLRHRTKMPAAQAALMALGEIDPSCADDVRIRTREQYRRQSR